MIRLRENLLDADMQKKLPKFGGGIQGGGPFTISKIIIIKGSFYIGVELILLLIIMSSNNNNNTGAGNNNNYQKLLDAMEASLSPLQPVTKQNSNPTLTSNNEVSNVNNNNNNSNGSNGDLRKHIVNSWKKRYCCFYYNDRIESYLIESYHRILLKEFFTYIQLGIQWILMMSGLLVQKTCRQ